MADWTALPVGIVIATLATLVGIGGGILWTPYLIFVAGLDPGTAVMTSLVIQVAGMGSGGLAAIQRGKTDPHVAGYIAAAAAPGVAAGVWLTSVIEPASLVFLLGVACMAAAFVFVFAREEYDFMPVRRVDAKALAPYLWIPPLLSVLTGLLSVGIGDFLVPVLRNRLGMKMDAAIGACLAVMSVNAALAAVLSLVAGQWFDVSLTCWAIGGVLVGGQIGPRIAGRISDQSLKEVFIYGLSLVGIHVLFNAW